MTITVKTTRSSLHTVNWATWQARDQAVLCFIRSAGKLLLILKKRGLGAGLFNAPGGRIEPGETPAQAAVRETQEEVGVTPGELHAAGVLRFAFTDGYGLHCQVFTTDTYNGTPIETDEADPFWCAEADIPYGRMWADDRIWLPLLLTGRPFDAHFIFDGELMLWHLLTVA